MRMNKLMTQNGNLDTVVRESLRAKILNGDLDGGFHLSELKISKEYNVSRTPVREALCALAADGLVEMVPHRGAFVTHTPGHTKTDQLQAYSLFVGLAAKLAADKANIEMLMDLETAFSFATEAQPQLAETYKASAEAAIEMVEKVANSPTVSEALAMLSRRVNLSDVWAAATSQQKELNEHFTVLLTALKRKKADAAEKTMRQLVTVATNAYLSSRKQSASVADSVTDAMATSLGKSTEMRVHN